MSSKRSLEVTVDILGRISVVRGQRVLLDSDLAVLYGVTTKRLNEQVRRNADRFPADFAFRLTEEETASLRSHFATLDAGRGKYSKYRPWAFTEHGAIMAASILSSPRAVEMTVYVVRAFVRLRRVLASHVELARELDELKRSVAHLDADTKRQFDQVYEAILGLMGTSVRRQ
jgi:ORF6N domain